MPKSNNKAKPLESTMPLPPKLTAGVLEALEAISVDQPIAQVKDIDPIMTLARTFGGKRFIDFLESD